MQTINHPTVTTTLVPDGLMLGVDFSYFQQEIQWAIATSKPM